MVMAEILVRVRDAETRGKKPAAVPRRVAAVHIDYGNRPESGAEADFVARWCAARDVSFFCTRVGELGLLRGVTERDEYEKKSKELRFAAYRDAWRDGLGQAGSKPRVLFGHHEGDVVENVLSNALKGRTILELSGMTPESEILSVVVARPMLRLPKTAIYDFSHRFGVPYFLDTTPRWSTRGQVRNEALPVLSRVYGTGFSEHLASLALQSDDLDEYLSSAGAMRAFVESGQGRVDPARTVAAMFVDLDAVRALPAFLWRLGLRRAAHVGGVPAPRDRAVDQLRERFCASSASTVARDKHAATRSPGETRGVWFVELRHGVQSAVFFNRFLVVWRPQAVSYDEGEGGKVVEVDAPDATVVSTGAWTVRVVSTQPKPEEAAPLSPESYFAHCVLGATAPKLTYPVPSAPSYVVSPAARPDGRDLPGFAWPFGDCDRRMWLLPQVNECPWVLGAVDGDAVNATGKKAKKDLRRDQRWVVVEFMGHASRSHPNM